MGYVRLSACTVERFPRSSAYGSGRYCPLASLAGHRGNSIEVGVVMKNHEASGLRRRGNQKVRDLAASLSSGCEKALNLPGSVKMVGSRFHELERLECLHQMIPLCGVPCRVSDLKVAYAGSSKFASFQARLDGASNFGSFETRENARVHQVRQRHASSRSTRSARARTSRDFFTVARRFSAARRRASFTVSLMVWVPSPARAASNASSSMSTRRFVMW
jgi:hypothetical protein